MHAAAKTTSFQCEKQRLDHPAEVTAITETLSPSVRQLTLGSRFRHVSHFTW